MDTSEPATLSVRTIAAITVATLTMYPLEALPDDVYKRDGEKLAEVALEDPVAARTIEQGASAPDDGRPSVRLPATDLRAGPTEWCLTEAAVMFASSTIVCC